MSAPAPSLNSAPQPVEAVRFVQWHDGRVEVVEAPPLSSISAELLAELRAGRAHGRVDDEDVVHLPGGYRYVLGDLRGPAFPGERLLHRVP